jgi:hypothetical protein
MILGWSAGAKIAAQMITLLELVGEEAIGFLFDYPVNKTDANIFSSQTEVDFVQRYFSASLANIIRSKLSSDASDVRIVWDHAIAHYKNHSEEFQQLLKANSQFSGADEVIQVFTDINLMRMLSYSQAEHKLDKLLMSEVIHFVPSKGRLADHSPISLFEERHEVEGNHYTMLEENIDFIVDTLIRFS